MRDKNEAPPGHGTDQTLAMPISAEDRRAIGRLWRVEAAPGRLRSGSMTVAPGTKTPYPPSSALRHAANAWAQRFLLGSRDPVHHVDHEHVSKPCCTRQRVNAGPPGCRNKGRAASRRSRASQGEASGRQCHSTHAHADRGGIDWRRVLERHRQFMYVGHTASGQRGTELRHGSEQQAGKRLAGKAAAETGRCVMADAQDLAAMRICWRSER
jgi:hypothetical protein